MPRLAPLAGGALLLGLLVLILLAPRAAAPADPAAAAREIAAGLRCPVCQNLAVADSPAALAVEMRGVIRERLAAGWSRERIVSYFVERYGEGVLLEPPRAGFTMLAWAGAAFALLFGAVLLAARLRAALAPPAAPPAPAPAASVGDEALLDRELDRYRMERR